MLLQVCKKYVHCTNMSTLFHIILLHSCIEFNHEHRNKTIYAPCNTVTVTYVIGPSRSTGSTSVSKAYLHPCCPCFLMIERRNVKLCFFSKPIGMLEMSDTNCRFSISEFQASTPGQLATQIGLFWAVLKCQRKSITSFWSF